MGLILVCFAALLQPMQSPCRAMALHSNGNWAETMIVIGGYKAMVVM